MQDIAPYRLADGSGIGTMPISHTVIGSMATHSNCLLEKSLSCLHIPLLAQHGINQITLVVDSSIHRTLRPKDFEVCFIGIPACSCLSVPFCSQLICEQWEKSNYAIGYFSGACYLNG
jgi:hypothetical protein